MPFNFSHRIRIRIPPKSLNLPFLRNVCSTKIKSIFTLIDYFLQINGMVKPWFKFWYLSHISLTTIATFIKSSWLFYTSIITLSNERKSPGFRHVPGDQVKLEYFDEKNGQTDIHLSHAGRDSNDIIDKLKVHLTASFAKGPRSCIFVEHLNT